VAGPMGTMRWARRYRTGLGASGELLDLFKRGTGAPVASDLLYSAKSSSNVCPSSRVTIWEACQILLGVMVLSPKETAVTL